MLYLLKITPMAFSDMQIGIKYYQLQRINLGKRFATVVDNALSRIKQLPFSASFAYDDVRYKTINKFPYVILYKIIDNIICVLRIFNMHQKPLY